MRPGLILLFKRITERINKTRQKLFYTKNVTGRYIVFRETLPINDNQILFSPQQGSSVHGNMYYLIEEAVGRSKYEIYVVSQDHARDKSFFEANNIAVNLVAPDSNDYVHALATSKYLATDTRFRDYFIKRDEQVMLNTWHGTPLKNLGVDVPNNIQSLGPVFSHFLFCDFFLFPNNFTMEIMSKSYLMNPLYAQKGMVAGYPRNAAFFSDFDRLSLKRELGIDGKKIYVYMPTFRAQAGNERCDTHMTRTEEILRKLDNEINDDTVIFYKSHRYVSKGKKEELPYKHILPFPENLEIYILLSLADSLITDYSSVFFDFACTGREIILFTFDADEYDVYRGLTMPLDVLPFTRYNTTEELIEHINNNTPFIPGDDYREFQKKYCPYDSAMVPKNINDVFLDGKPLAGGQMTDYAANKEKAYNVYFISTIHNEEHRDELFKPVFSDPNALLAIPEKSFEIYGSMLSGPVMSRDIPFIPVRMDTPMTLKEKGFLMLYRRTGLFKKTARKIMQREKKRIFPCMSVAGYTDLSDSLLFRDMTQLL